MNPHQTVVALYDSLKQEYAARHGLQVHPYLIEEVAQKVLHERTVEEIRQKICRLSAQDLIVLRELAAKEYREQVNAEMKNHAPKSGEELMASADASSQAGVLCGSPVPASLGAVAAEPVV